METQHISNSDKEKITNEIKEAVNTVIMGCEALDMDLAFSIFSNSPDFLMIGMDGSLCDYQTYLKNNRDYLMTCSSFTLTTLKEEIKILRRDLAIFAWIYKAEATLKTGEKDIFEKAGATFVFHKIHDEWKVVYYHESTLPPTRISDELK
jgi:hypothetical protein